MMNIFYISFALLLFTGIESSLLGPKECTYGPSYWCATLRNSAKCGAVTHCIQTVWEKQVLPNDDDSICKICLDMVKQARDQLLSNETQDEIKQVFEGSCHLIPLKVVADECIKLADQFIPELIETLTSEMNPQVVCATAGLCNSPVVDLLLKEHLLNGASNGDSAVTVVPGGCDHCTQFVSDVINTVKRQSKTDLLNHLLSICGRLSSLSDGCRAVVESNFNAIYEYITQELKPKDFCDLVGMCERLSGSTVTILHNTGDETCDFCEAIVTHWRAILTANTTKDEFKMVLQGICKHTGTFTKECLSLVDEYYNPLYDILVSEIKPKELCQAAGLCGPQAFYRQDTPLWSTLKLTPQDLLPVEDVLSNKPEEVHIVGQDEANSYKELKETHISISPRGKNGELLSSEIGKPHLRDSNECVICEFSLHFLQNVLQDKHTREEIKEAVDNLCTLMPKSVVEECQDYVDAYGDQLIQFIILEIDPSVICPMIHMCPSKSQPESLFQVGHLSDTNGCVMCEFAMTTIKERLKDNKTDEAIKEALETLCNYLPKSIGGECNDFVKEYFDQILHMILNGMDPEKVCAAIGLCPGQSQPSLNSLDASQVQLPVSRMFLPRTENDYKYAVPVNVGIGFRFEQTAVCIICEFIMSKVDGILLKNSTEMRIVSTIDHVCLILPNSLQLDCLGFMEEYGKSLVELIIQQISPDAVCSEIGLCKESKFKGLQKASVQLPVDDCMLCEEMLKYVQKQVNGANNDISAWEFDVFCQNTPESAHDMCSQISNKYGPFLLPLLHELKSPKKVCQALQHCPLHTQQNLLGEHKCTWGPSYWCQTQMHANACKATRHCEEKVWGASKPAI